MKFGLSFKNYLRLLSVLYFIGLCLHIADLFDLRLKFSQMNEMWRTWTVYLIFGDAAVAYALWKTHRIGLLFLFCVSGSQLVAYVFFRDIFGEQWFLVGFHLITLSILTLLRTSNGKT